MTCIASLLPFHPVLLDLFLIVQINQEQASMIWYCQQYTIACRQPAMNIRRRSCLFGEPFQTIWTGDERLLSDAKKEAMLDHTHDRA